MSQAPPLTVAQVRWLEHLAASLLEPYEKLVACILCYMLYARARNSDIARAASVLVDLAGDNQFGFGFVEAQVRNPKQKTVEAPGRSLSRSLRSSLGTPLDAGLHHPEVAN